MRPERRRPAASWPAAALLAAALLLPACSGLQRPKTQAPRVAPAKPEQETTFPTESAPQSKAPRTEAEWADVYYNKGDFRRSIALLSDAVRKDESNAKLWRNLGSAYAMADDFDNAILHWMLD